MLLQSKTGFWAFLFFSPNKKNLLICSLARYLCSKLRCWIIFTLCVFFCLLGITKNEVCLEILTKMYRLLYLVEAICIFLFKTPSNNSWWTPMLFSKFRRKCWKTPNNYPLFVFVFLTFLIIILQTALEFFKSSSRSLTGILAEFRL